MIPLEDLEVYKVAMEIGDIVYEIVVRWEIFDKKSLGDQIIRSADSIGLNISEGYGRFHFKENKNFCWYSRGSLFETKTACIKAKTRKLMTEEEFNLLLAKLVLCHKLLNAYIKSIGTKN
jgi:four helix bundle protein